MPIKHHNFIDFETVGLPKERCAVLSLAGTYFTHDEFANLEVPDIHIDRFKNRGINLKFDLKSQVRDFERTYSKETIEWWKRQSEAAQLILAPDPDRDLQLKEGLEEFFKWVPETNPKETMWWCRGNNFDLPLLEELMIVAGVQHPIMFWNFRDVRSFIGGCMLDPSQDRVPLAQEQMEGFVYHDGLSDCAKDVMMIMMSARYAAGEDLPENPHKDTIPFSR